MDSKIRLKQGDTFSATVTVERDATPVNLTSVTITSEVRRKNGDVIGTLTVTPVSLTNGTIKLRSETSGWPVEFLEWDVQFIENGDTWSIPTQSISILKDVTGLSND